jgi:uncharacterized membrane protein YecN with MAPEG domain
MVLLSVQTSMRRAQMSATHGDAGDETLRRRVRAHGNFSEYAPFAVVLVLLVELAGFSHALTAALAVSLAVSRVLHAIGMLYTSGPAFRAAGMLIQHAAFIFAAALLMQRAAQAA